MLKIAPSILSADFSNLAHDVLLVEQAGAEYLHIDVMDGHFVPNITLGPVVAGALRRHSSLVFDVHLMIENPGLYIDQFAKAGADIITVHVEACRHLHRTIGQIKENGVKAGVAINPATSPAIIEYILHTVDLVLIMTVNPGFGGQSFIPEMLSKIASVKKMIDASGLNVEIEVDGGIDPQTAPRVARAGANVLVAGSAIFAAGDPGHAVRTIRQAAANNMPGL